MLHTREHFDAMYNAGDDPWHLKARWYEQRKRALPVILYVLNDRRLNRVARSFGRGGGAEQYQSAGQNAANGQMHTVHVSGAQYAFGICITIDPAIANSAMMIIGSQVNAMPQKRPFE